MLETMTHVEVQFRSALTQIKVDYWQNALCVDHQPLQFLLSFAQNSQSV